MLRCVKAEQSQPQHFPTALSRSEYERRAPLLRSETDNLLEGDSESRGFQKAVDSVDPRTRMGMLHDVAQELQTLGIVADIMNTAQVGMQLTHGTEQQDTYVSCDCA